MKSWKPFMRKAQDVGIIANLMVRILSFLFLVWMTLGIGGCRLQSAAFGCLESRFPNSKIARIDEPNTRVFLVLPKIDEENLIASIKEARLCFPENGEWREDLSISIFSHERYVGYITEDHIKELTDQAEWRRAYLAEYYEKTGVLKISPLVSPKWITLKGEQRLYIPENH